MLFFEVGGLLVTENCVHAQMYAIQNIN